jgi:hypothetical protein
MSSPVKVITIESLEEKLEELKVVKNKIEEVLQIECKCLEDIILQKYIRLQSAAKVADYLNDEGYRIMSGGKLGERKYGANDVTKIINDSKDNINVNEALYKVAKTLYNFNTNKAAWITVFRFCKSI